MPAGTRTAAVLATITSKNSSPVILMHAKQTENLDSATYYSSTDSINFSEPRLIRVYSSDYSAYAQYTVTVYVHKELPYEFKWHELAQNNSQLAAFSDLKAVACGDAIYVFGKTAEGLKIYKTANTDGMGWQEVTANVAFRADDCQNVVSMGNSLYILSAGKIYASADGSNWQERVVMLLSNRWLAPAARTFMPILLPVSLFQRIRALAGQLWLLIRIWIICLQIISL